MTDYLKFYDLEKYLFEEVGPRFRQTGVIEPVDFFMIFVWKSNRAKTKVREKLKTGATFREAVEQIAASLHSIADDKQRLQVLMKDWGLKLPMASAVLTVLFPEEFTVYDRRVCDELGIKLRERKFSDSQWAEYQQFKAMVVNETPSHLTLRNKDRFLFGRSLRRDAERDWKA